MKRIARISAIVSFILTVIFGTVLILALDKVDPTPYFKTDYYAATRARLDSALAGLKTERGRLLAGFSRVSVTPSIKNTSEDPEKGLFAAVYLAGYGDRETPATGVHDSIYARAVALQTSGPPVVLIGMDLLLTPPAAADSACAILAREAGIKREQLYFGATHTHSGAGSFTAGFVGQEFSGVYQPAFVNWLARRLAEAVKSALADLRPARIGAGHFKAADYVHNRMIGETGRLNDIFTFLCVEQDQGRKAVLGAFAAHATTLGDRNLEFSGDYPGYWERKLESQAADLAVFFAGTVGSHSYRSQGDGFERARYIGEALADSVQIHLSRIDWRDTVSLTQFSCVMDLPKMQIRVSDNRHLDPYLGARLIPGTYDPMIQALQIDRFIWMTLPGELSGEYAIDLKNALTLRGYRSIFSSFNGDYLGYIVPQKYYHHDSYESRLMGWYGHHMGDYLMELLFASCQALTGEKL